MRDGAAKMRDCTGTSFSDSKKVSCSIVGSSMDGGVHVRGVAAKMRDCSLPSVYQKKSELFNCGQ